MIQSVVLWLYGSHARGDSDFYSDVDVLLISSTNLQSDGAIVDTTLLTSGIDVKEFPNVGSLISKGSLIPSCYSWDEIAEMATYGSLFLHHLRLEGKCLWESEDARGKLGHLLERLPSYSRASSDLDAFRMGVTDVRESLIDEGSVAFEITVLATILRHASILGCYLAGNPNFGRTSPVKSISSVLAIDQQESRSLLRLCQYRVWIEHDVSPTIDFLKDELYRWCDQTEMLIVAIRERLCE